MRASCCARARDVRSRSKSSLRSSAPRAAPPQVLCQHEVVVGELAHLAEHDEHTAAVVSTRQLEGGDEQRAVARGRGELAERLREALVLEQRRRREDTACAHRVDERLDAAQPQLELGGLRLTELVPAGQLEPIGPRHQDRAEGSREGLAGGVGEGAVSGGGRDRLSQQ